MNDDDVQWRSLVALGPGASLALGPLPSAPTHPPRTMNMHQLPIGARPTAASLHHYNHGQCLSVPRPHIQLRAEREKDAHTIIIRTTDSDCLHH